MITTAGFTPETHRVETDDGYLLKIHRILPKIQKERKGPVLLIHGLFGTAADFLIAGPDIALGEFRNNQSRCQIIPPIRLSTVN